MNIKNFFNLTTILFALFLVFSCQNKNKPAEVIENNDVKENVNPSQSSSNSVDVTEDLSGKLQIITEEQFYQFITEIDNEKGLQYKGKTPAIVDFYADWCRPCIALNPTLEELALKYKGKIIIYKVNVDKAKKLAASFEIQSIPTLIFFKPNAQPTQMVGAPSKSELEKAINEILL